jgi:hypothetical protein
MSAIGPPQIARRVGRAWRFYSLARCAIVRA